MVEEKKTITQKIQKTDFGIDIDEMNKAGVYFGHRISRCHPKMKPYILGVKGGDHINIIDLEKTKEFLIKALEYIEQIVRDNKILLVVGTKFPTRKIVEEFAQECDLPYVSQRWIGGTITNFKVIRERIDYFLDLERKKKEGELEKYTKKEQLEIDREISRLEKKFGGIKNLKKIPDAIFVLDMKQDSLAVREAKRKRIPIIAIADTNVDPSLADYFIPANDDAISSVKYILDKVKEVVLNNKRGRSSS